MCIYIYIYIYIHTYIYSFLFQVADKLCTSPLRITQAPFSIPQIYGTAIRSLHASVFLCIINMLHFHRSWKVFLSFIEELSLGGDLHLKMQKGERKGVKDA